MIHFGEVVRFFLTIGVGMLVIRLAVPFLSDSLETLIGLRRPR